MQSISRQVNNILRLYAKRAFDCHLPIQLKPIEGRTNKLTHHYRTDIAQRLYRMHEKQQFTHIEPQVTSAILADEMLTLMEHVKEELEMSFDSFGVINIKLSDKMLQDYTNSVAKEGEFQLWRLQTSTKNNLQATNSQVGVVFPVLDMLSPISLSDCRRWVHMEWIARTNEQILDREVQRKEVVVDNSEFTGIVMGMIREKKPQKQITLPDIARFLADKKLQTKEVISSYARTILEGTKEDLQLKIIYEDIYKIFCRNRSRLFAGMLSATQPTLSSSLKDSDTTIQQKLIKSSTIPTFHPFYQTTFVNTLSIPVKVGEADSRARSAIEQLEQLTRDFAERLKQLIPGLVPELKEKAAAQWLRYYFSRVPASDKIILQNSEAIISMMLTRAEQRNDIEARLHELSPGASPAFKIANGVDREFAWLLCRVGDCLNEFDFAGAHSHLDRMHVLLKATPSDYYRMRVVWAVTKRLHEIIGME